MGIQLKQHAGALLAGLALFAASLATDPSVAEAQSLNRSDHAVGQVVAQDAAHLKVNTNVGPNAAVMSRSANQQAANQQSARRGFAGGQNINRAERTIGQVAVQNGANLYNNANLAPNVAVLSRGVAQGGSGQQVTGGQQVAGASFAGNGNGAPNTNTATNTLGQVAVQDGLRSEVNLDASPNVSVLSPGSDQGSGNVQGSGAAGFANGDGANDNSANNSAGQVVLQDGVNPNANVNASPNVSVLSPGSTQGSGSEQSTYANGFISDDSDAPNDNAADSTTGQIALQDSVDGGVNLNANPNVSVLSPDSAQESNNEQSSGSVNDDGSVGGSSLNQSDDTVGQVAVQNGLDLAPNANASPNVAVLSGGSEQQVGNEQDAGTDGSTNGTDGGSNNTADDTMGQVAVQDAADLSPNTNVSPNVSALSPGSDQSASNDQSATGDSASGADGGSAHDGGSNNAADETAGQVLVQNGADIAPNVNASPNVSVLSPNSTQESGDDQSTSTNGDAANDNVAEDTIGQVVVQNSANSDANLNASPNVSVLSPDSEQGTTNEQSSGADGSANDDGTTNTDETDTNSADDTVGQVVVQGGLDAAPNTNVSPNVSALSPGSAQETSNEQDSGSAGTTADNSNTAADTLGQIVVQDSANSDANLNASPNVSVLSPGSEQSTTNGQDTAGTDGSTNDDTAANNGGNTNTADDTMVQIVVQDAADIAPNTNVNPKVSVLSPASEQTTTNEQGNENAGEDATDDGTTTDGNNNSAEDTVVQIVVQDAADLSPNTNSSPNTSVLSPGSQQTSDNEQATTDGPSDGGNTNTAEGTVVQVVVQDSVDVNPNTNINPNVVVLSPDSEQTTDNCQNANCANEDTDTPDNGGGDTPGEGTDTPGNGPPDSPMADTPDGNVPGDGTPDGDVPGNGTPDTLGIETDGPGDTTTAVYGDGPSRSVEDTPEFFNVPRTPYTDQTFDYFAMSGGVQLSGGATVSDTVFIGGKSLEDSSDARPGVKVLPDTGGSELWTIALGMALIALGLTMVARKRGDALR